MIVMDQAQNIEVTVKSIPNDSDHHCQVQVIPLRNLKSKKQHVKAPHKNINDKRFSCNYCQRKFKSVKNYNLHINIVHNVVRNTEGSTAQISKKCPLCGFQLPRGLKVERILKHFYEEHDIAVIENTLEFKTIDDFNSWRHQEETASKSKYIIKKSRRVGEKVELKYVCHRSGFFKSEGQGIRSLKLKGSVKINAFCPAGMTVERDTKTGFCKVKYIGTHVGHTSTDDKEYLYYSKEEKEELAEKIASGMSYEDILDEYNSKISHVKTENENCRVLTKKDLYNIKQNILKSGSDKSSRSNHTCEICNISYSTASNLRKHSKTHPNSVEDQEDLIHLNGEVLVCKQCGKEFEHADHIRIHLKFHECEKNPMKISRFATNRKCPLCAFYASQNTKVDTLHMHFFVEHQIVIIDLEMEFQTIDEFLNWKLDEERTSLSRFIVKTGYKSSLPQNSSLQYYICQRSGFYRPVGEGKKAPRKIGSKKINGYCPARIKLIEDPSGKCKVSYINTHVGHSMDSDVNFLNLSKEDRLLLISKIISGMSFDDILAEAKLSERLSLQRLTRLDLRNIRKRIRESDVELCNNAHQPTDHNVQLQSSQSLSSNYDFDELKLITETSATLPSDETLLYYVTEAAENNVDLSRAEESLERNKEELKRRFCDYVDSIDSLAELNNIQNIVDDNFFKE